MIVSIDSCVRDCSKNCVTTLGCKPGRIEIIRYGDYVQSTSPPLSVNVTKIDPLRGECLTVIHSQVVFQLLRQLVWWVPSVIDLGSAGQNFHADGVGSDR
jgi:hypothetical protein